MLESVTWPPEHDCCLPVLLPPDDPREVLLPSVEGVPPRGGAVAGVVVARADEVALANGALEQVKILGFFLHQRENLAIAL